MHITLPEFEEGIESISFPLAVAVSGGMDSLALLLLAHELAQKKGSYVIALTVNHNLRPEAKLEADQVNKWTKERGIQHVTLEWIGEKPRSHLQERARKARYSLLIEWCKQHQISTLLLGHHQQDQEETFWLRLSSGSGLEGLAGMKKCIVRDGVTFLRPLLGFSKDRIKETLITKNQDWIEDPSNQNTQFFRGRVRHFLHQEGLSSSRLLHVMKKFERDSDFIQVSLQKAIETLVQKHESGYLTIKKESFNGLHPAIAQRLLSFLIQWFSNTDYPPRSAQVINVMEKINKGVPFTTGGIYWFFFPEEIALFREQRAIKEILCVSHLQEKTLWDQRFWVDPRLSHYVSKGVTVGPLGKLSRFVIAGELPCDSSTVFHTSIPKRAWPMLPAIWEKGKVVAVPHLCYDVLKCGGDLRKFIYLKPLFHDSLRFTI